MTETLESPSEALAAAKSRVERAGTRLLSLLAHVPDDRLTWSPSPTSRSALRLVAHCAAVNLFFADILAGRLSVPPPTPEAFSTELSEAETRFATREEAVAEFARTQAILLAALDTAGVDGLDAPCESPFGPLPARFWAGEGSDHPTVHSGQLAYLQTVWGDLDDHMG